MLLVYCHTITPRLQYIVSFFNEKLFETPAQLTNDKTTFLSAEGTRLNYSTEPLVAGEFFIRSTGLLFENTIQQQSISCFEVNGQKAFFRTDGNFPFDIFAAAFYLLSRYEEYLPYEKDMYGRYAHTNSLAFREKFLDQPLINLWMEEFKKALLQHYPELRFRLRTFKCVLSYDIDIAYSYLHKGWYRTVGGFARSIIKGQWQDVAARWEVLRGNQKDPFDCFEWLDAWHLYCRIRPYYFFLVAKKQVGYDKNTSTQKKAFRDLIEYTAASYKVGLHPSWQTGDDTTLLGEEQEWLEVVADKKITHSRQHYIRFTLPGTFRELLKAGIEKDFSMGYGSINGFRASVCSSFYWYDLENETTTPLKLYPFCFMDANAFYEQRYTPQQAYSELMHYYQSTRKINGMLITVWHNSILGTDPQFKGWRDMFELFMKETVFWDAYYDGR